LRESAFGDDDEARIDLGFLLLAGERTAEELTEAAFWFLRAAADGERPLSHYARYAFGFMCEHGLGTTQDGRLATKWYLLAAEGGVSDAGERLDALALQNREPMSGEDWMLAAERLVRARSQGVASAAAALESLKRLDPRAAAYADLLGLVGMDELKEAVRRFIAMATVDRVRRDRGLPVASTSLHCVFLGPPGTGKTTVARILGKLLGSLGILSRGHVKEVDRAGLVGRYVGETAQKVDEVIQEALGGVLFIDEAYSLSRPLMTADFGGEAIDTLVKRMEDHRSDLVVIAAGYEEEMESFLDSNPGLGSRFPWHFRFTHYSGAELLEVFRRLASADGMTVTSDCAERAGILFADRAGRERSFGNGRFARTVYEKARVHQATRLWQSGALSQGSNDQLQTLLGEDLPPPHSV
jgi:Holliday junction resolvasome RuvABC ATP-dependent DNA helicase subunit